MSKILESGNLEEVEKAQELFQLLSTYETYRICLLKAEREHTRSLIRVSDSYTNCFTKQINDLFKTFTKEECLMLKRIFGMNTKNHVFLIDNDHLLVLNTSYNMISKLDGVSSLRYKLYKIGDCKTSIYKEQVYVGDPYYCDNSTKEKTLFGIKNNGGFIIDECEKDGLENLNNKDIREVLRIQSIDEIFDELTKAKDEKVKKLIK